MGASIQLFLLSVYPMRVMGAIVLMGKTSNGEGLLPFMKLFQRWRVSHRVIITLGGGTTVFISYFAKLFRNSIWCKAQEKSVAR
jgi:hypothetical protein